MCKANDRMRLGSLGEKQVIKALSQAINELGFQNRTYANCILQYDSVYGRMTSEMDLVFFSPDRIYIFEVKKARFRNCNYNAKKWELFDEEKGEFIECSNPLNQNQYHKSILCELLKIPLHCVTTVEVLLGNGKDHSRKSPFPNDYIFDANELLTDLRYVLVSSRSTREDINIEQAHTSFLKEMENAKETGINHIQKLEQRKAIREQLKEQGARFFKFTDRVQCPECGSGFLSFEKCIYEMIKNGDKACRKLYLQCSRCGQVIDYTHPFVSETIRGLTVIDIKERNGWTMEEKHMNTVLNEKLNWEASYHELENTLKESNRMIISLALRLNESDIRSRKKDEKIAELEVALEKSTKPFECFKRLMRFLFDEFWKLCALVARVMTKLFKLIEKLIVALVF